MRIDNDQRKRRRSLQKTKCVLTKQIESDGFHLLNEGLKSNKKTKLARIKEELDMMLVPVTRAITNTGVVVANTSSNTAANIATGNVQQEPSPSLPINIYAGNVGSTSTSASLTGSVRKRASLTKQLQISQSTEHKQDTIITDRSIVVNKNGAKEIVEREVKHSAAVTTTNTMTVSMVSMLEHTISEITSTKTKINSLSAMPAIEDFAHSNNWQSYGERVRDGYTAGLEELDIAISANDKTRQECCNNMVYNYMEEEDIESMSKLAVFTFKEILNVDIGCMTDNTLGLLAFCKLLVYADGLVTDMLPDNLREEVHEPWCPKYFGTGPVHPGRGNTGKFIFDCTGIAKSWKDVPAIYNGLVPTTPRNSRSFFIFVCDHDDTCEEEFDQVLGRLWINKKNMPMFLNDATKAGLKKMKGLAKKEEMLKEAMGIHVDPKCFPNTEDAHIAQEKIQRGCMNELATANALCNSDEEYYFKVQSIIAKYGKRAEHAGSC